MNMSNEISKQELLIKCSKRSIHFWWVIGVLSTLLITSIAISVVCFLCEKDFNRLLEILNIVSTLLAITLSIFSILYSYSTSQDASKALSSVASEVAKIEATYTLIENHMSTILNSDKSNGKLDVKKALLIESSMQRPTNKETSTNIQNNQQPTTD